MRRRLLLLLALTLTATLVPAAGAPAQTIDPTYRVEGRGWGHGVGMSQYGARAMAEAGRTADQILATYYGGVTVKGLDQTVDAGHWIRSDPTPLWIGLAQNQTVVRFQMSGVEAGLCKANDGEGACPTQFANPGEIWEFRALGGGACQFFRQQPDLSFLPVGNPGSCRAAVEWVNQPGVHLVLPDLPWIGAQRKYAWGTLRIRPAGEAFHVVLEVGIEEYIRGIGEVPSTWPAAALEAQAIAARTYGVRQALRWGYPEEEASFDAARKAQCWCQLYSTVVDQNYVGLQKETADSGERWVAAVKATAGRVVTHPEAEQSTVIVAYYSSSSGGHTDSNVTGLGHSQRVPYLAGTPDPWSIDPLAQNPFASWTKDATASQIAAAVGLDSVTGVAVTGCNPTGTVGEVTVGGLLGGAPKAVVMTGRAFKAALGMRSITFSIVQPPEDQGPISLVCSPGGSGIPDAGFTDVSPDSVHKTDIDYIAFYGITQGTTPTTYSPRTDVARWQMALFLVRSAARMGIPLPDGSAQGFEDVAALPADVQTAVNQLAQLGITTGTSATTYEPTGAVSRWQMALFLTRLYDLKLDLPAGSTVQFTDLDGLSPEALISIGQLLDLGITTGTSPTTFTPAAAVTREQMASFLARLLRQAS